ncbi:hypothetical protein H9K76_14125 [Diaphorobacter ruginosibacter]|uniref:Uncharacterized protein n=1 Tax=Diaphorobacter ruginosibacter TaxID=1715720 RepID=A0A7G9RJH6_9BURK|nr:hypothetical protein [Diaphorobacter ruginosibacter]QNN55751.1 hypothetical protein H9K76_14125 [Diaphorobacter ruginosibacter]
MMLDPITFSIYDIQQFPIVTMRNDAIRPGYAQQWEAELERLIDQQQPFVIIFPSGRPETEDHEDRKWRILWFKANKQRLGGVCRALISIEPDASEREAARAREVDLSKVFGVPLRTVENSDDAIQVAQQLFAHDAAPSE